MSTFSVNTAQVTAASNNVRKSIDIIRGEVSSMMSQLNSLQSSWSGTAANQFADITAQWHATQSNVEVSLESIKTALDATANHYQEAEANIALMFRH